MSTEKLKLDIVTPYGPIYSEEVDEVTATGSEGEFGVLPGHAPFITTLKAGMLTARSEGQPVYFFVSWGYAEVSAEKVLVLADSAERADDIDVERAREAAERAREKLKMKENVDFARAEAALERAVTRTEVHHLSGKK